MLPVPSWRHRALLLLVVAMEGLAGLAVGGGVAAQWWGTGRQLLASTAAPLHAIHEASLRGARERDSEIGESCDDGSIPTAARAETESHKERVEQPRSA